MTQRAQPTFSGHELSTKSAVEIAELLRSKDVSRQELIDISIARIEATEPAINAMPTTCENLARSTEIKGDRKHPGWLAGMPIGIKDLSATKDVRTTFGTKGHADLIPDSDDPIVTRLAERGGVMIGKTNTPEFGAGANTFNDVFGATRNPWDTSRNAGGSSGGAAASLAVGQTWLSHGSDHAGSLRTPAAYCGIVGFRPSPGRVPGGRNDAYRLEGMQGPMARTVTDCAFFLDAMAGFDPGTPASFDTEPGTFLGAVRQAAQPPRISFAPSLGGYGPVAKDVEDVLSTAMLKVEKSGATIEQTCPDITNLEEAYRVLRGLLWATALGKEQPRITKHLKETLTENLRFGQNLTVDQITTAELTRSKIFANMVAHFETYDVLACAVVGCPPGPLEEEYPTQVAGQAMNDYISWLKFAFLATTTGLPAMSLPVGFTPDGMPVGLQLIGPPRGEARLMQTAKFMEDAVNFPRTPIDPRVTRTD